MKRGLFFICLFLVCNLLFAEEILYQKTHQDIDRIDVITLIENNDHFEINIVSSENYNTAEKLVIICVDKDKIQALLYKLESEYKYKYYYEQLEALTDNKVLFELKETYSMLNNVMFKIRRFVYLP